jgi:tripartite ATP-independent transporter DctM subunit
MNTGGITDKIFRFAKSLVGHIPGGLGHANIIGSIIFSGMSGSAVADAAGLGQVEMKAMIDEGYDPEFSAAVTAASATVGPIIPPSIPMVLYGAMAEVSVGALFLGGFIPGLLLGVGMMILVYFISIKRKYLKSSEFNPGVGLLQRLRFDHACHHHRRILSGAHPLRQPNRRYAVLFFLGFATTGILYPGSQEDSVN